jgi:phage N-6-adenine-methyltransferase
VTIAGFRAQNHPQQTAARGATDAVDDRGTDPAYVAEVAAMLGGPFTLDVAASAANTKAPAFYDRLENGLVLPWVGRIWCNPPYSDCGAWVRKAWAEWEAGHADVIAMLLPANRTEQAWWQDTVEPYRDAGGPLRVRFQRGRMRFDRPTAVIGPKGDRPPFGCVLLTWTGQRLSNTASNPSGG